MIELLAARGREQDAPLPSFGTFHQRERLTVEADERNGHAHAIPCEMGQDRDLGLLTATPSMAIDAQKVSLIAAGLDLVGVVEPTRVQTTAADRSQSIWRRHLIDQAVDDLMTLREIDSPIDGHPNPALGFPFFDAATGSLGQGFSVAGGLGCAARIDGIDKVVYCIIGDGESREGQIWEAMDFIRDQRLSNVVALFNCNGLGQSDFVSREQDWTHLQLKAEAFGWTTVVIDGHDPEAILAALGRRAGLAKEGQALVIIARTVKGWGVPALQGTGHHGTPVPKDQLELGAWSARPAREGTGSSCDLAGRNGAWLADRPADGDTDSAAARAPARGVHGSRGWQHQGGEIGRGKEGAVAATRFWAGAQSTRRRQSAHPCARRRRQELDVCGGFRQGLSARAAAS